MKKTNLLKSMLLLCVLVAGSGSVWADETHTSAFTTAAGQAALDIVKAGTSSTGGDMELRQGYFVFTSAKGYDKSNELSIYTKGTLNISLISGVNGYIKSVKVTYANSYPFKTPTDWSATSDQTSWSYSSKITAGKYVQYSTDATNVTSVDLVNDASGKTGPRTIEITYVVNNISASINSTYGYATMCSKVPLDFTGTGVTAYIITGTSGSAITTTEVTKVPANTALLVTGTTANIPTTTAATDDVTGNLLKAVVGKKTTISAEAGYTRYVLSVSAGKAVFMSIGATDAVVPVGKAYLEIPDGGAHELLFIENGTTFIPTVKQDDITNGEYFNLAGQRVTQPTKGLYLMNGKKVIIK